MKIWDWDVYSQAGYFIFLSLLQATAATATDTELEIVIARKVSTSFTKPLFPKRKVENRTPESCK